MSEQNMQELLNKVATKIEENFHQILKNDLKTQTQLENYFYFEEHEKDLFLKEFSVNLTSFTLTLVIIKVLEDDKYNALVQSIQSDDYEKAYEIVLHEWFYAQLEVTMKWNEYPDLLNRKIAIPIRYSLDQAMFAMLATLRLDASHLAAIETLDATFILDIDEANEAIGSVYASEFPFLILKNNDSAELVYDYGEGWEFELKYGNLVYIYDEEESLYPVRVLEAEGYGIYEDNKNDLIEFIKNPEAISESTGNLISEDMEFDFYDAYIEELKYNALEDFQDIFECYQMLSEDYN